MPIKSLQNAAGAPFPRIGKLHKGGQRSGGALGQDLTHFRFSAQGDGKAVEEAFTALYGSEPAMLRVYLPYDDVASNFSCWMEQWGAGGRLIHRCDGEYCVKWLGDDGHYVHDPDMTMRRPCPFAEERQAPNRCREVGRLDVILPELWEAGHAGVVTLETHSVHDIVHIDAVLRHALEHSVSPRAGLRGIEFALRRQPQRISRPGAKGPAMTTKWLVKIEPAAEWLLAQLQLAREAQLGGRFRPAHPAIEGGAPAGQETGPSADERPEPASPGPIAEAGEAAPATAPWVHDRDLVHTLVALGRDLRLSKIAFLEALGVSRLGEIAYGYEEALERVRREGAAIGSAACG